MQCLQLSFFNIQNITNSLRLQPQIKSGLMDTKLHVTAIEKQHNVLEQKEPKEESYFMIINSCRDLDLASFKFFK